MSLEWIVALTYLGGYVMGSLVVILTAVRKYSLRSEWWEKSYRDLLQRLPKTPDNAAVVQSLIAEYETKEDQPCQPS